MSSGAIGSPPDSRIFWLTAESPRNRRAALDNFTAFMPSSEERQSARQRPSPALNVSPIDVANALPRVASGMTTALILTIRPVACEFDIRQQYSQHLRVAVRRTNHERSKTH
jgi:hypothetical protein